MEIYDKLYNNKISKQDLEDFLKNISESTIRKIKNQEIERGKCFVSMIMKYHGFDFFLKILHFLGVLTEYDTTEEHPLFCIWRTAENFEIRMQKIFSIIDRAYSKNFNILYELKYENGNFLEKIFYDDEFDNNSKEFVINLLKKFNVTPSQFNFFRLAKYLKFDVKIPYTLPYDLKNFKYLTISTFFDNIAEYLLNRCDLIINCYVYKILEIEFYLYSDKHPDEYVHQHKDQLTNSEWYFHKAGKSNTYRGGTFKGLDITFGDKKNIYGGILLRTIENIPTDHLSFEVIEGSCRVVNAILELSEVKSILELTDKFNSNNVFECDELYLKKTGCLRIDKIYKSPRVGLKEENCPDYTFKNYRYYVHPEKIKKNRDSMKQGMRDMKISEEQIKEIFKRKFSKRKMKK